MRPQFIGIVRRVIYIYIYIRTSLHTYDIVYVDYLHIYTDNKGMGPDPGTRVFKPK